MRMLALLALVCTVIHSCSCSDMPDLTSLFTETLAETRALHTSLNNRAKRASDFEDTSSDLQYNYHSANPRKN